jgi:hypothetical protein
MARLFAISGYQQKPAMKSVCYTVDAKYRTHCAPASRDYAENTAADGLAGPLVAKGADGFAGRGLPGRAGRPAGGRP